MTMMPPTPSITCKTVGLHANSPVSRPEVGPKGHNWNQISSNWSTVAERVSGHEGKKGKELEGCSSCGASAVLDG